MLKTRKFIQKRVKITKKGKVLVRPLQQDHFLAKKSGNVVRRKRKTKAASQVLTKLTKTKI